MAGSGVYSQGGEGVYAAFGPVLLVLVDMKYDFREGSLALLRYMPDSKRIKLTLTCWTEVGHNSVFCVGNRS